MLNFTVGPVMSFEDTLRISSENSPYFRTQDFSDVVLGCESRMLALLNAPAGSRCVFLTASGTGAMEATVMGVLKPREHVAASRAARLDVLSGVPHLFEHPRHPLGAVLLALRRLGLSRIGGVEADQFADDIDHFVDGFDGPGGGLRLRSHPSLLRDLGYGGNLG